MKTSQTSMDRKKHDWQSIAERVAKDPLKTDRVGRTLEKRIEDIVSYHAATAYYEGQKSIRDGLKVLLDISIEEDI